MNYEQLHIEIFKQYWKISQKNLIHKRLRNIRTQHRKNLKRALLNYDKDIKI